MRASGTSAAYSSSRNPRGTLKRAETSAAVGGSIPRPSRKSNSSFLSPTTTGPNQAKAHTAAAATSDAEAINRRDPRICFIVRTV